MPSLRQRTLAHGLFRPETGAGNGGHSRRTWVAGLAVGTHVVARNAVNEILQHFLVARLLALVERTVIHGGGDGVPKSIDAGAGRPQLKKAVSLLGVVGMQGRMVGRAERARWVGN